MAVIEIVAADHNRCGEAPIWDFREQRLIWADIESSLVFELHPNSNRKTVISRNLPVAGIGLHQSGDLVFAGATGLHRWSGQDRFRTVLAEHEGEALVFNDLVVDARGRIYAGTIYWDAQGMRKPGKLYCIEGDGSARVVDEAIQLSNGLGFSPDDEILYYTDSAARKIYAYDIDPSTGVLSNKRLFVEVSSAEGIPDGLTVDNQGFVWSAQWFGAQVVRYDPDGKIEQRIEMPVKQVSSLAFGGNDLTDLYVTSAADSWTSNLAPPGYDFQSSSCGGQLFRIRTSFQGRPEHLARLG